MAKKSEGFGDDVEKAITLLRLEKVRKLIIKKPCTGCGKRKEFLNKLIPYNNGEQ